MKIAIQGCGHGEMEKIYDTIQHIEQEQGFKVDLLICCGDFQSTRNLADLKCMACPDKYKDMCTFYKYYSGEAIAPVLTLFIGGNHEASNYLQELAYGGWVAPNIYYLGYAGVVSVNGIRIAGLSGIYKGFDYLHGHHEKPPYDDSTLRSCYHIRNLDVFRLKQLSSKPPDIMLSHDWPRGVTKYGNAEQLMRFKKHFQEEIEQDRLGSGPTWEILETVKPDYWFSAHLHCKFAALVEHDEGRRTKFLALDKCLPGRRFLQLVDVGAPVENEDISFQYDPHWLAILRNTKHLMSVEKKTRYTPGPGCGDRYDFSPTNQEIQEIDKLFEGCFDIPYNFSQSVLAYKPNGQKPKISQVQQPQATVNIQTTQFCQKLGIQDPMSLLVGTPRSSSKPASSFKLANYINEKETNMSMNTSLNPEEISINETSDDDDKPVFQDKPVLDQTRPDQKPVLDDSELNKSCGPISLPAPQQEEEDDVDLAAILNTEPSKSEQILNTEPSKSEQVLKTEPSKSEQIMNTDPAKSEQNQKSDQSQPEEGGLFFIDKQGGGESKGDEEDNSQTSTPPVKKLKRRNIAMYSIQDS